MKRCDLCMNEVSSLEALREEYKTQFTKEICDKCMGDSSAVLYEIKDFVNKKTKGLVVGAMRRWFRNKKRVLKLKLRG